MTAVAQEIGTKGPGMSLEEKRWAASQELLAQPGRSLADMSDAEFEEGLRRVQVVQQRMVKILATCLRKDVHYGNPETSGGRTAFQKPILYQAGAEELRRLMQLHCRDIDAPIIHTTSEVVSVIVRRGIFDRMGRLVSEAHGACHSLEARFRRFDKKGMVYDDPREKLHDCLAIAIKRADVHATREASGATGFLSSEEMLAEALTDDAPITPWTKEERDRVGEAAQQKGLGREAFKQLKLDVLGRTKVGSGEDVAKLLAAIAKVRTIEEEASQPKSEEDARNQSPRTKAQIQALAALLGDPLFTDPERAEGEDFSDAATFGEMAAKIREATDELARRRKAVSPEATS